jgi:hypothetical protein
MIATLATSQIEKKNLVQTYLYSRSWIDYDYNVQKLKIQASIIKSIKM